MQSQLNICKSINIILHINGIKDRNHTITSIDFKKNFGKVHSSFMIIALKIIRVKGTFLYDTPTASIVLNFF